jgi:hypothetical protein
MIHISKLLPEGNIADPTPALQVQWLYMSYHYLDRAKYVKSGKVLETETLEMLTAYFQVIHDQKVADGLLSRQQQQSTKCDECHDNKQQHKQKHTITATMIDAIEDAIAITDGNAHTTRSAMAMTATALMMATTFLYIFIQQPIADPCVKHSQDGSQHVIHGLSVHRTQPMPRVVIEP